jgi:gliding motility-associated-like protein
MRHWYLKICLLSLLLLPLAAFSEKLKIAEGRTPAKAFVDPKHDKSASHHFIAQVEQQEPPVITGQSSISTPENTPVTIQFSDLTVSDPDSNYPEGFTMTVYDGVGYTVSGFTVTPDAGFSGTLTVPVSVNDGTASSELFNLQVSVVAPVNQPPTITGQVALSTPEETPLTISLSHLSVTDPDNNYPGDFTLSVSAGTDYTVNGATITPAAGYSGTLSVPVTVNDGTNTSVPFSLSITVTAVNTPPTITGQTALTTPESTSITLLLSHLTVTDPDNTYPNGFSMAVGAGSNYTVSGTTVTPVAGFSGTLTVPVTVNDGTDNSAPFNLSITVSDVNAVPVITGQVPLTTPRNTPITIQLSHLTVQDSDNNYPTGFTLNVAAGLNYTVSGTTVTPSDNFTGSLSISVTVNDGTDSSAPFTLVVGVEAPANVAPSITGQSPMTINENATATILLSHLTVNDPDDVYPQGFTLTILPGTNYTFNENVVTPAANFTGTLTVKLTVNDGEDDSQPFNFSITVNPQVNVAPKITGQVPITINKNQPLLIELSHLIVSDPDNVYPNDFTLAVIGGTNYSLAGDIITPALNFTGVLTVKVTVSDGETTSAPFNLSVTVIETNVNQPPVITGQVGLSTLQNVAIAIGLAQLTVNDPDDTYPTDFTLSVLPGANYTVSGTTVRPALNFIGLLVVNVKVNDGTVDSAPFGLKIQVIEPNVLQIIGQLPLSIQEDSSLVLKLTDLKVNDTESAYPTGFTLNIASGEHYAVDNQTVIPDPDYFGNLVVGVTVTKGTTTTPRFDLLVVVTPINDAPYLENLEPGPLFYRAGKGSTLVTTTAVAKDVDDAQLLLAEIGFNEAIYQQGSDFLLFENTVNIRGIFDENMGVLTLIGAASLEEYTTAMRSVQYQFASGDTLPTSLTKTIWFRLNDGKIQGPIQERAITLGEEFILDIPNAFTPNDDLANDTWKIGTSSQSEALDYAVIRVYNKRGMLVFEGTGLQSEWDGRYNGEVLPADTYFYTIELNLPFTKSRHKGVVMILR